MRVLHTSDWHLGKSIGNYSRLEEQRQALDELIEVVKENNVDLVIVSGDIFDTFVPRADAEQLFYEKTVQIGRICDVVCISGNHDDGQRLCAPSPMAKGCKIHLINGVDSLSLDINGERVNIALLPYPFVSRILKESRGESNDERIRYLIDNATKYFKDGINIFVSHLFILGSELAEDRELGTAPLLSLSILPDCDYIALGHIHKQQRLGKKNCFYSGSLLNYSFDDTHQKVFLIYDSDKKETTKINIKSGKKLLTSKVNCIEDAIKVLQDNEDKYVKLIYSGSPLMPSDMKQLKSHQSFCEIKIDSIETKSGESIISKADYSPAQLFSAFYEDRLLEKPNENLVNLFLSLLGEQDEAD